jgi:hypothetical protein
LIDGGHLTRRVGHADETPAASGVEDACHAFSSLVRVDAVLPPAREHFSAAAA